MTPFSLRAQAALVALCLNAACACDIRPPGRDDARAEGTGGGGGEIIADAGASDAGVGLVAVEVAPAGRTLAVGTTLQLTATGVFADGSRRDLTAVCRWSSSISTVAGVSTAGRVSGLMAGTAVISAELEGEAGSMTVQVTSATLASISVTPMSATIARGTTLQFTATGLFSDATNQDLTDQVAWSSSAPATATVSAAGVASGVTPGSATISAALLGVSGAATLAVTGSSLTSLAVTPIAEAIAVGTQQQFTATGTFSDNSTQDLTAQVSWSSSNLTVATLSMAVGEEGLVSGVGAGSATITASQDGLSARATLTVAGVTLSSLAVTPANASISPLATQQYTATGTFSDGSVRVLTTQVTWTSADPNVATISNAAGSEGLATAQGLGGTSISASLMGRSASAMLTVNATGGATLQSIALTPSNASMAVGTTRQYTATGTYSDGTTRDLTAQVSWTSSSTATATVSNTFNSKGLVSALATGSTTLSAALQGVTGSTALTVTAATLSSITLTPATADLPRSFKLQFRATGTYSDGSTQDITANVTWASGTPSVATISNAAASRGVATAVATGTTRITATVGSISGAAVLTVTAATLTSIAVSPASFTLANGQSRQLTATGTFSDNTQLDLTRDVTWSSSSFQAQVSATGLVSAFSLGGNATATITAARAGVSGTSTATITP